MKHRSFEEAGELLSNGIGECPPTHIPVAHLTIKLIGRGRTGKTSDRSTARRKRGTDVVWVIAAVLLFVAAAGAVLAMSYLGEQLCERVQQMHSYRCECLPVSQASQRPANP